MQGLAARISPTTLTGSRTGQETAPGLGTDVDTEIDQTPNHTWFSRSHHQAVWRWRSVSYGITGAAAEGLRGTKWSPVVLGHQQGEESPREAGQIF